MGACLCLRHTAVSMAIELYIRGAARGCASARIVDDVAVMWVACGRLNP